MKRSIILLTVLLIVGFAVVVSGQQTIPGSGTVTGAAASGSPVSGNPVLVAGSDGTNARNLATDTSGHLSSANFASAAGSDGIARFVTLAEAGAGAQVSVLSVTPGLFNGTTYDRGYYCPKTANLAALGAATTQIVAAVASQKIRICSILLSNTNATATNVSFVEGTGANCVTGQTTLIQPVGLGATPSTVSVSSAPGGGFQTTTASDALCLTGSAAGAVNATISYNQY
jgi:hypothetical protein